MMRGVTGRLMLLDTASLYFRAYFGVPDSVRAPDGTPVNAVRGLLDFIDRLVQDHRPDDLVACMDADWRPQWRVELIPSYKAHRVAEETRGGAGRGGGAGHPLPAGARSSRRCWTRSASPGWASPGYEADDVIGTFTGRATGPVDIVTGDRDLYQLVGRRARGARAVPAQGRRHAPADGRGLAAREVRRGRPRVRGSGAAARRPERRPAGRARASARRPPPSCWPSSATWPGSWPRSTTRRSKLTPSQRKRLDEARPYVAVAPKVVRVAADVPLPDVRHRACRATPRDPARAGDAGDRWGWGSLRRLMATLRRVMLLALHEWHAITGR